MVKKTLFFLLLMAFSSTVFAATYYISPSGNDSTGNGSNATPWATVNKAFSSMSGGDTLICKDGTYTGDLNKWGAGAVYPPVGTAGAWTIIKAEHDGKAIFDGEYTRQMVYLATRSDKYWQFEGLIWCKAPYNGCPFNMFYARYVKFLRCGAFDAGDGNATPFNIGRENSYVLMENCYAYGNGRYGIMLYLSTACVVRQCVVRSDSDYAWSGAKLEPIGGISIYSCDNVEVQNCIVLDADNTDPKVWSTTAERAGSFNCPATDYSGTNISFRQCLALNNMYGGLCSSALAGASAVLFDNCIAWKTWSKYNADPGSTGYLNLPYGYDTNYINCTFGVQPTNGYVIWSRSADNETDLRNCLIYQSTYTYRALRAVQNESYNAFYNVTNALHISSAGYNVPLSATDLVNTINPIWSVSNSTGGIKYIPRMESGNNLSTLGSDGGQIGANVTTIVGSTGTLYGEAGYNTATAISMWPFPYEDLIKVNMNAYSRTNSTGTYVSGNRGFASTSTYSLDGSTMTLTKYIWEYLGNQIPVEIYGSSQTFVGSTVTVTCTITSTYTVVGTTVSFQGSASTTVGSIASYQWSSTGATFSGPTSANTDVFWDTPGTKTVTLTATDSNNPAGVGVSTFNFDVNPPPHERLKILGNFKSLGNFKIP